MADISPTRSHEQRENQPLLDHSQQLSPVRGSYQGSLHGSEFQGPRSQLKEPNPLANMYVRTIRVFLIILVGAALLAIVLLSVDAFRYLGLSAAQGPGIDILGVMLIALASLALSLLFYSIPSRFERAISILSAIVLLVDIVMILSVPELRHRTGIKQGPGIFVFALFTFLFGAWANKMVYNAKKNNDMRIYGHYDDRKTLTEWLEVFLFNIGRFLIFIAVVIVSANLIIDAADSNLSPLGSIVPIDVDETNSVNIHIACTPAGKGPLVLVEAGHHSAEESARWVIGSDHIGAVCYWDRPGYGFSDNAPSPLAIGSTVDIFVRALEEARPTYKNESIILVSHGVGSLYSRVLAARLGKSVSGMMFVDGLHEELFYDTWGIFKAFWHFITGTISPFKTGKLTSVLQSYGAEDRVYGRIESLSPRFQKAMVQELSSASHQSRRDIGDAKLALAPHIPLLVVSSSDRCKDSQWSTYQRLLLKLSDNVLAWKIIEGPHELWRNSKSSKELTTLLEGLAKYI